MRTRSAVVATAVLTVAILLVLVPSLTGAAPASVAAGAGPTSSDRCESSHWVGTWQAPPQSSSLGRPDDAPLGLADGPERRFEDQTLRMIVTPHVAGSAVRVHLTNRYGTAPLSVAATTVAVQHSGASVVLGSMEPLTFGGSRSVVIPAGEEAVSDPLFVNVAPFTHLAVSFAVDGSSALDYHQWAQSTHYVAPAGSGDHADDESGAAFTEELFSSYGVTAVDVLVPSDVGAIVALGDSITDGIGSSPNTDQRWPDQLARRLAGSLSVVNAGIGGNHVARSGALATGDAARDRVAADALRIAGVTDLVVYEGINDLFMADPASDPSTKVIDGYRAIIADARAADLRVIGATITPAGLDPQKEAARQRVNEWIRTSGAYDAVVDFDAVVRDPKDPTRVRPDFVADLAHLTDRGYRALAEAIDPSIFQGTGCG